jgi:hypothetical protein
MREGETKEAGSKANLDCSIQNSGPGAPVENEPTGTVHVGDGASLAQSNGETNCKGAA